MNAMNDITENQGRRLNSIRLSREQGSSSHHVQCRRCEKLLGLKKTESYWLVHRKFFRTRDNRRNDED